MRLGRPILTATLVSGTLDIIAAIVMTLIYGLVKREPIIILGQALSVGIYVRNVMFVLRERRAKSP